MANERSELSKYKSRYSPDTFVTPSQYAAELVCECVAAHRNERLPTKFWQSPKWTKTFVYQKTLADRLLKKYESSTLINGIKSCITARVKLFSLKNPQLRKYLICKENNIETTEISLPQVEPPRPTFGKKSLDL